MFFTFIWLYHSLNERKLIIKWALLFLLNVSRYCDKNIFCTSTFFIKLGVGMDGLWKRCWANKGFAFNDGVLSSFYIWKAKFYGVLNNFSLNITSQPGQASCNVRGRSVCEMFPLAMNLNCMDWRILVEERMAKIAKLRYTGFWKVWMVLGCIFCLFWGS